MRILTKNEIIDKLRDVGLQQGDTIFLHSDFSHGFWIDGCVTKKEFFKSLLECFNSILGEQGTLIAHTFTYDYARNGTPFVLEKTSSELDQFSEYIRKLPNSVRSEHPIFSMSGYGRLAKYILQNNSQSAFGYNTPYDKGVEQDAKLVFLNTNLKHCTFLHHIEQLAGVSYMYNKSFKHPVIVNGKETKKIYNAYVRYLNTTPKIELKTDHFQKHLNKIFYTEIPFGNHQLGCIEMNILLKETMLQLQKNACYLIKEDYYNFT